MAESVIKNYIYDIEAITPVHVGNGMKLKRFELVPDSGEIHILNLEKIAENNPQLIEEIIKALTEETSNFGDFSLYNLLNQKRIQYQSFIKYSLKNYNVQDLSKIREIVEFIKTAGRPFIPGSSIKGAIMKELLSTNSVSNRATAIVNSAAGIHNPYQRKDFLIKQEKLLFEGILGDPKHSFAKFIRISDTEYKSANILNIANVKIMAINLENNVRRIKWFVSPSNYVDFYYNTMGIFCEVIPSGVRLSGTLGLFSIELFKNGIETFAWFNSLPGVVNGNMLMNILKMIRNNIKDYISREKGIFANVHGSTEYVKFLEKIEKMNSELKQNEILIRIGANTGFLTKSVLKDPKSVVSALKSILHGRVYTYEFPKTRKVIVKQNGEIEQPGWVKITFTEQGGR